MLRESSFIVSTCLTVLLVHCKNPLSGLRLAYGSMSSVPVSTYYRTSILDGLLEVDRREQSILSTLDTSFTVVLMPTPLPDEQKKGSNNRIQDINSAVSSGTPTEREKSMLFF